MRAFIAATMAACPLAPAAQAQDAPKTVTLVSPVPVDAARVDAARAFLDVLMPPDSREKMFEDMVTQMMGNMLAGLGKGADLETAAAEDPRVRGILARFFERQRQRAVKMLHDTMPELMAAYANAYARNFTVEELRAMTAFFSSPVGRRYSEKASALIGDPDVSAWMQSVMAESRDSAPDEVRKLKEELAPLLKDKQHDS